MSVADVHELSREHARRVAVRAQLLDLPRPDDILDVVRHLTMLQADPTNAVAPNADLVLWSRIGNDYDRSDLADAAAELRLIDLQGMLRPAEDLALYRADMLNWVDGTNLKDWQAVVRRWVTDNDGCRRDILERLRQDGPLPGRELPDTCERPWKSTGWTNNKNVRQLLEFLMARGEVAAAGWDGRDRLWDLAERIYPDDEPVPTADARRIRNERRLAALGIARAQATESPVDANHVGAAGEPAVIEGVKGQWRVDAAQLSRLDEPFAGRVALLSPLDRLVYDRKRMVELFEFDYQLEMYKPVAKRRWGYWALPILSGDRLVGKVDATADRTARVLRINAVHEDEPFSKRVAVAVADEINDLAGWLRLDLQLPG